MVREQRIAAGLGLFAVIYLIGAWRLPRFTLTAVIDAHIFPLALGAILLVLSLLYYLQAGGAEQRKAQQRPFFEGVNKRLLLQLWASTLLYALLLSPLGYLLATSLFLAGVMWLLGVRPPGKLLAIAVGFALVTYALFAYLLGVPLSRGILPL